jgi:hypothetical protein
MAFSEKSLDDYIDVAQRITAEARCTDYDACSQRQARNDQENHL